MADWNADLYRRFEEQRTRPARDLLERVPLRTPGTVVDLGCGPGNSTELLVEKFPAAEIIGVDTSDDMLQSARKRLPKLRFEKGDIATWQPQTPPDLIYANAAFHWVPDHGRLIPRLFAMLAPGGVLAFQVPANQQEPSHRAMGEIAREPRWSGLIGKGAADEIKIENIPTYYDLLTNDAVFVDAWLSVYQHPMASAKAIVDWFRTTGLRPYVESLTEAQRTDFLAAYEKKMAAAYPERADGQVLLPFPRLFVVAQRKG